MIHVDISHETYAVHNSIDPPYTSVQRHDVQQVLPHGTSPSQRDYSHLQVVASGRNLPDVRLAAAIICARPGDLAAYSGKQLPCGPFLDLHDA